MSVRIPCPWEYCSIWKKFSILFCRILRLRFLSHVKLLHSCARDFEFEFFCQYTERLRFYDIFLAMEEFGVEWKNSYMNFKTVYMKSPLLRTKNSLMGISTSSGDFTAKAKNPIRFSQIPYFWFIFAQNEKFRTRKNAAPFARSGDRPRWLTLFYPSHWYVCVFSTIYEAENEVGPG